LLVHLNDVVQATATNNGTKISSSTHTILPPSPQPDSKIIYQTSRPVAPAETKQAKSSINPSILLALLHKVYSSTVRQGPKALPPLAAPFACFPLFFLLCLSRVTSVSPRDESYHRKHTDSLLCLLRDSKFDTGVIPPSPAKSK
jgi:hypothetical protein